MIIRPNYINFIKSYFNTPYVKILTRIHRGGKFSISDDPL